MIFEIQQIQRHLAKKFGLKMTNDGAVISHVPDGTYDIPLGVTETLTSVEIKEGRILIKKAR